MTVLERRKTKDGEREAIEMVVLATADRKSTREIEKRLRWSVTAVDIRLTRDGEKRNNRNGRVGD